MNTVLLEVHVVYSGARRVDAAMEKRQNVHLQDCRDVVTS